jgi:radical SAM protein with 4Fe4S-binding SPASM domain
MPTNGSFIRGDTLEMLLKNMPDKLQFSIDGATKDTFEAIRKVSDFEDVIANFRSLCERRLEGKLNRGSTIGIECALQRQNLYEFHEMYALYSGLPKVDTFDLVPVYDYEPEGSTFSGIIPSMDEVHELHRLLEVAIRNAATSEERAFYLKWRDVSGQWTEKDGPQSVNPDENRHACVVPWYNTYIDAKGLVYPCCFLAATELFMGNVFEEPFQAIWTGQRYREFRDRIVRDRPNLQGCRTCPRNDDSRIRQFNKLRFLIGC